VQSAIDAIFGRANDTEQIDEAAEQLRAFAL
jgi:hypothetical protein